MNSYRFSRLDPSHAYAMSEIEKRCFSSPWSFFSCENELKQEYAYYLGAFDGETLVGYAGLHIVADEGGNITNIAVSPEFRRRGIARELIKRLLYSDLRFFTLEVRESNAAAVSLYESLGFNIVGRRKGYYNDPMEDAFIMNLER